MMRIFSAGIALAVVLIVAPVADANDIASSTMHFKGTLTPQAGGVYTGTIPATAGTYYVSGGPGEAIHTGGGFDVYAKEGACAYVQGFYGPGAWNCDGTDTATVPASHDAYPLGGPWGPWYDPDIADWNQYDLELTKDHWYLRYRPTGESPMSGMMKWGSAFAWESDLGTQDGAHDGSAVHGGGPQAWDWDNGWGVEVIPLQTLGFDVTIADAGGGEYEVTLTPAGGKIPTVTEWGMVALMVVLLTGIAIKFGTARFRQETA